MARRLALLSVVILVVFVAAIFIFTGAGLVGAADDALAQAHKIEPQQLAKKLAAPKNLVEKTAHGSALLTTSFVAIREEPNPLFSISCDEFGSFFCCD